MFGKIFLYWAIISSGVQLPSESDTVDLQQVDVYAPSLEKYAVGQQIQVVDKKTMQEFSGRSLGDLLQQNSALYLRQYGEGMVSSLTMRGTSAGHTAVFWNGLPVNSPSLGQADFSLLPTEALGTVAVHHGSSGALYGTDAIGGSVHMYSDLRFNQGHQVQVSQGFGSFGRINSVVTYGYSKKNISTQTKVYRNTADNDFTYRDLTKPGRPETRTTNAAVKQWGIVQDLGWNLSPSSQLSTSIWYDATDRQIQPLMGSNSKEVQEDNHLRWVVDYKYFLDQNALNLKAGVVRDLMVFNVNRRNQTIQYFLSGEYEWNLEDKFSSKLGARYTYVVGDLSSYSSSEHRVELYSSTTYRPMSRLAFSLNLRQAVYDHHSAPFTPSLSGEFDLVDKEGEQLTIKASLSRSYKTPTLNDRFWEPGGNPDLIPEKGVSWETGLTFQKQFGSGATIRSDVVYYRMGVENWIIWLPQGNVWSPSNIREVKNQGLEISTEGSYDLGRTKVTAQANYAYNQARNLTKINENDRSFGKQLPYTPLHKAQWKLRAQRNKLEFSIGQVFTGERFDTTDNESGVPAYTLWNAGFDRQWEFSKLEGTLGFGVFNLLNEHYQTMKLRAMPGRNYQINIKISI